MAGIDHDAQEHHGGDHHRDRQGMAERHGGEREEHDPPAVPVQPECHGEQPAHGRIDPVEHAEPGER